MSTMFAIAQILPMSSRRYVGGRLQLTADKDTAHVEESLGYGRCGVTTTSDVFVGPCGVTVGERDGKCDSTCGLESDRGIEELEYGFELVRTQEGGDAFLENEGAAGPIAILSRGIKSMENATPMCMSIDSWCEVLVGTGRPGNLHAS